MQLNTIEEALSALQQGQLIVVVDDEDRENEGDLICAAEFATPEAINFMASKGRGLICMPMSTAYCEKLDLPPMVNYNTDNHETAFTVSIDHKDTSTGISAFERSMTALACVNDNISPSDFRRPGHMFPLRALPNGVLERNGHTEATVDLLQLAGLKECGVCCEILHPNGGMQHRDDLEKFVADEGLIMVSIAQLQQYRKAQDNLVERHNVVDLPTAFGEFKLYSYVDKLSPELVHLALVKGEFHPDEPVLTRLHSECLTGDVFGSQRCDCGEQLATALAQINEAGQGVLLYLRQEGRGIGLLNKLKAYHLQEKGMDTLEANQALGFSGDMREYYIAAQMLHDLNIHSLRLLTNNPDKLAQLRNYGIQIAERVPLQIEANQYDAHYLHTKKDKMGHLLNF